MPLRVRRVEAEPLAQDREGARGRRRLGALSRTARLLYTSGKAGASSSAPRTRAAPRRSARASAAPSRGWPARRRGTYREQRVVRLQRRRVASSAAKSRAQSAAPCRRRAQRRAQRADRLRRLARVPQRRPSRSTRRRPPAPAPRRWARRARLFGLAPAVGVAERRVRRARRRREPGRQRQRLRRAIQRRRRVRLAEQLQPAPSAAAGRHARAPRPPLAARAARAFAELESSVAVLRRKLRRQSTAAAADGSPVQRGRVALIVGVARGSAASCSVGHGVPPPRLDLFTFTPRRCGVLPFSELHPSLTLFSASP